VPPENAGFMVAAYTVAAVILVIYAVSLAVRLKGAGRRG
jgi:putative exporter of polyketide antibiotics